VPTAPEVDGVELAAYVQARAAGTPHNELFCRWLIRGVEFAMRKGDW